MNKILVSICIPTFNRSHELGMTLQSLVRQKGFDSTVEIVIVDNASTDSTEQTAKKFARKHKNIRYVRNKTNIGSDNNMVKAAMLGKGTYIKLLNDNKSFTAGALQRMKSIYNDAEECVVFFKNVGGHGITRTATVDDFLRDVSIHCTWLAGVSFRRDLLHRVGITKEDYPPYMSQTGVMLKLLKARPTALVVSGQYMTEPVVPIRTGYNFYEVFGPIYIGYLSKLLRENIITKSTFKKMKRDILHRVIFPFTFETLFNRRLNKLGTDKALYHLFKNYKKDYLLYLFPLWVLRKMLKGGFKKAAEV